MELEDHKKGQKRVKRVQKSRLNEASDLDLIIGGGDLLLSTPPLFLQITFEKRHIGHRYTATISHTGPQSLGSMYENWVNEVNLYFPVLGNITLSR